MTASRPGGLRRSLAWGGLVGPAVFVADWAILGAISRLAEQGASTRPAMTGGFVIYGVGLAGYGIALRPAMAGPAWLLAIGTGIATLGVAAAPLGTPTSDTVHAVFAASAYACLAGIPIAMAKVLAAGGRRTQANMAVATGVVTGALLLVSATVGPAHGLTQRIGLTLGDVWVAFSAAELLL
jgi:hypothetical protein